MAPAPPPRPDRTCTRCLKPITPGTAAQVGGRPVHMRCLARETQLEAIERQDGASLERPRGHAAMERADELMDIGRGYQTTCAVCGERLGTSRGVLFEGDSLVHAVCWRAEAASFTSSRPLPTSPEPRATILIVEDHADTRDAMGVLVTELGYRAVLTANGTEALAVLQSNRPDLILCDVRMPSMDGVAFITAVRSAPGFAGVKVVAVTGLSGRGEAARLRTAGFDAHLVKPLDYDVMLATLDRLLRMPPKR